MKKGETLKFQELLKLLKSSVVTRLTSAGCRDIKKINLQSASCFAIKALLLCDISLFTG